MAEASLPVTDSTGATRQMQHYEGPDGVLIPLAPKESDGGDLNTVLTDHGLTGSNPLPVTGTVQLSGSMVEEVSGVDALRVKQTALAYESWVFQDNGDIVEVPADSFVRDTNAKVVNGYGTVACIARAAGQNHQFTIRVIWSSKSTYQNNYVIAADLADSGATQSAMGASSTYSEYLYTQITNSDAVNAHTYHVAFILRV